MKHAMNRRNMLSILGLGCLAALLPKAQAKPKPTGLALLRVTKAMNAKLGEILAGRQPTEVGFTYRQRPYEHFQITVWDDRGNITIERWVTGVDPAKSVQPTRAQIEEVIAASKGTIEWIDPA